MFLSSFSLTNFRNYTNLDFKFKTQITIFLGNNAQGKTNILEAVYFLATSKSFKADRDEELISYNESSLYAQGLLKDKTKLEVTMFLGDEGVKKKLKVNGVERRVFDYSGNLVVIEFLPEDLNLVIGSPSIRRNHLDSILTQIDKNYKKALSQYEEIVTSKNRLLKRIREGFGKKDELDFWIDKQLLLGKVLSRTRFEFLAFLNTAEKRLGEFSYEYIENVLSRERLDEYLSREIESATSLIGPHRDDFIFKLNQKDLAKFGSRGEQRTAVLDLKIAEVDFIENVCGARPVLLLDDIFSELDHAHQQHVINLSKLQQTIITGVELDYHIKQGFEKAAIFFVADGQISEIAGK